MAHLNLTSTSLSHIRKPPCTHAGYFGQAIPENAEEAAFFQSADEQGVVLVIPVFFMVV